MADNRRKNIKAVLEECFWGEYTITVEDTINRLDKKDTDFIKFLFSKIIENSRYPSRHIKNLFSPAIYNSLIKEYQKKAGDKKRFRLIYANPTGNYDNVPEYQ
ncbi:MAG: hypothetical protein GX654_07915 [Desulfatiglans sp.]|nr:hypothetical protein [Desulfatiglans sp.]